MKHLSWLYILLILAGCTDTSIEGISTYTDEEFYATIEGSDSRTYVDDQVRLRWTAEDCVTIFKKTTYNREFMFTGVTGANAGGFKQKSVDDDFWYGSDVPYNYAVYPHSSTTQLDETDHFFTFTMPSEQTYVENSFGLGANTMVAVSESGQLTFKNVGSYLRVRLYGKDVAVSSITLASKGNEAIAGKAKVTPALNGNPTCEMLGTGKSIRLTCPEPVTISEDADNPTDFWIVVPPVTLANGFSVTVENEKDDTQVFEVVKEFTFERNLFTNMKREVQIESVPTFHVATAGTLSDLIPDDEKISIEEMKVTGFLNGKDITTISRMAGNEYIGSQVSFKVGNLKILDLSEATFVEDGTYYAWTNGTGKIKNNEIGAYMFSNCNGLEVIALPNNIEIIEKQAFSYCRLLSTVILPKGVKFIKEGVFYSSNIGYIELPESLQTIGDDAFMWCKKLSEITIPSNVTSIGKRAFYQCELNSVDIYGNCTIGDEAFDMAKVNTLNIHNGLKAIGNHAFSKCKFTSLNIPGNIEKIGDYAFNGCYNLDNISFNGTKTIGESAFYSFKVSNLIIPETVTSIGDYAFTSDYLEEVNCKAVTPPSISDKCFRYYGITLYVPKGSLNAYKAAEGWKKFINIMEK